MEGWKASAYLHRDARACRSTEAFDAASLLSPFDPVVWYHSRAERLFQFDYRTEIVLPFLLGERLVARMDLKADRAARRLRVQAAYLEPGADSGAVAQALAAELAAWAGWLDLDAVASKGGVSSRALAMAVRQARA